MSAGNTAARRRLGAWVADRGGSIPPEILEARRRQLGVPECMLNSPMSEPVLDCLCITARIGQRVTCATPARAPPPAIRGTRSAMTLWTSTPS